MNPGGSVSWRRILFGVNLEECGSMGGIEYGKWSRMILVRSQGGGESARE